MVEYSVLFATKISAKSKSDMERKAEATAEAMSRCLRKTVLAQEYAEIEKVDRIKQATLD